MRSMRLGGTCADCGTSRPDGAFWRNNLIVLDYGTPEIPVQEPDTTQPIRCDDCETRWRVYAIYANHPDMARRVYAAATPEAALSLLGVRP